MRKKRHSNLSFNVYKIISGIIILSTFALWIVRNIRCNDVFFKTSLHNILLLLISIVITYYLAQKRMDDRRKQDGQAKILERLINSIQDNITLLCDNNMVWGQYLIKSRFIGNKITALKTLCENTNLEESVRALEELFISLKTLVEDARVDIQQQEANIVSDKSHEMQKVQNSIIFKCDSILCELYSE